MRQAKFDRPVASEIDIRRQFQRILPPESAAASGGMTEPEYKAAATEILDSLQDFIPSADGKSFTRVSDPRLGFRTAPLDVEITVDPTTGRLPPYANAEQNNPVKIKSSGLGSRALHHLGRALALRLQKRDFFGKGVPAILKNPPAGGKVSFTLKPLTEETNLLNIPDVKDDMRTMWACSMFTRNEPGFLCPREFAMTYTRDRNAGVNRRAFQSKPDPACNEKIQTDINCDPNDQKNADKMAISMFHTHPQDSGDSLA